MHIPTVLDNANVPLLRKKKKRRGPRISPLAASIAGGSAVALVAYKKRSAVTERNSDSSEQVGQGELGRHVADMIALDQEMAKSIRRQLDGDALVSVPQAQPILEQSAEALERQISELEDECGANGRSPSAWMKKLLASMAGAVAPIIGASRSEGVSRTLRDDAVGLRLAAISSSMLETAANAEGNSIVARIAKDGGDSFSRLAQDLEDVVPEAVKMEYEDRLDQAPDPSAINDSADQVDINFAPSNRFAS